MSRGHSHSAPQAKNLDKIISEGKTVNTRKGTAAFGDRATKIRQLLQGSLPESQSKVYKFVSTTSTTSRFFFLISGFAFISAIVIQR